MLSAYREYWVRFVDFSGSSTRGEYWWPALFTVLGFSVLLVPLLAVLNVAEVSASGGTTTGTIGGVGGVSLMLTGLWAAVNVVPAVSVSIRRLHDTNRSGWWWFVQLVPFVGPVVFVVLMVLPGVYPRKYSD